VDFEEIAPSGAQVVFMFQKGPAGEPTYSFKWSSSAPRVALLGVYALQNQRVAVGDFDLSGGMGVPWNPPPAAGCVPVLIATDQEGLWGRVCPNCEQYWRARHPGLVCPYCGRMVSQHYQLLSEAQQRYVAHYCLTLSEAMDAEEEGSPTIELDDVAEAAVREHELPHFYHAETRQQHRFDCHACGAEHDVLGRYAYCGRCGTRNDLVELEKDLEQVREHVQAGRPPEDAVRDAVSAFDSLAAVMTGELVKHVPMTRERSAMLQTKFHDLERVRQLIETVFGVDICKRLDNEARAFLALRFHRRHVYEHKGGEADEQYVKKSGDAVRLKQRLRETQETAYRTVSLVAKVARNLDAGFHEILPPIEEHIQRHREQQTRPKGRPSGPA
jgi:hypothetical protein